jgi:hypothetical protein
MHRSLLTLSVSCKPFLVCLFNLYIYCVEISVFLGTFPKCTKRLLVLLCLCKTAWLPWNRFSWNLIFEYFSKIRQENSGFINTLKRMTGTVHEHQYTFLIISHSVEWEMFQAKVEEIKTHILCSGTFVLKIMQFIRCKNIVESDTSQMTIWRTLIVCWISKATNTLEMCKSYGFSTATMVAQMYMNVTLHIHFLTCYMIFNVTIWNLSWHFSIYNRIYKISFSFWY